MTSIARPHSFLDAVQELLAVSGRAQAHRADGGDPAGPEPGRLGRHAGNRRHGPLDRRRSDRA